LPIEKGWPNSRKKHAFFLRAKKRLEFLGGLVFLRANGPRFLEKTWCPKVKTMFLEELLVPHLQVPKEKNIKNPNSFSFPWRTLRQLIFLSLGKTWPRKWGQVALSYHYPLPWISFFWSFHPKK
jgi:hypothetical protein